MRPALAMRGSNIQQLNLARGMTTESTPAGAVEAPSAIGRLDIRVGVVRKVWQHPNAERLYVEEIDVGEPEPRQIVSGLQQHYTLEEMMGRAVLVVCNLKKRKLRQEPSLGMVLCASVEQPDGAVVVELIQPAEGAVAGDRVYVDGTTPDTPETPNKVEKLKLMQAAADLLRVATEPTAGEGGRFLCLHAGSALRTASGLCTVQRTAGGHIS